MKMRIRPTVTGLPMCRPLESGRAVMVFCQCEKEVLAKVTRLILLHGAPGDGRQWQPVLAALNTDIEVICPTLRWFGPESWPDDGSRFGTRSHTEQLIALLEKADTPAAVAAWSYSTHVVLNTLIERPDLIASAFLYEPGLHTYLRDEASRAAFDADARAAFGPVVEALQSAGPERAVAALIDASGGDGCFARMPEERRRLYLASARIMPLLLGGGEPPAPIGADQLSRIARPVTVGCGSATRALFAIASTAVADAIPGATLRMVDGADHMLPEKEPAVFAALLADWLASEAARTPMP